MEGQLKSEEKNPHLFKSDYSKEEINEIVGWFEERKDKLPRELRLNASSTATNLSLMVENLIRVLKVHRDNMSVTFCGYMAHLQLIRQRLQEQGME